MPLYLLRVFYLVPLLGILFIWAGIRRILSPPANDEPGESILWGSVGIGLGAGILGLVAWLFFVPAKPPPTFPVKSGLPIPASPVAPSIIDTPTTQPVQ